MHGRSHHLGHDAVHDDFAILPDCKAMSVERRIRHSPTTTNRHVYHTLPRYYQKNKPTYGITTSTSSTTSTMITTKTTITKNDDSHGFRAKVMV
jgi:hypothetical protein